MEGEREVLGSGVLFSPERTPLQSPLLAQSCCKKSGSSRTRTLTSSCGFWAEPASDTLCAEVIFRLSSAGLLLLLLDAFSYPSIIPFLCMKMRSWYLGSMVARRCPTKFFLSIRGVPRLGVGKNQVFIYHINGFPFLSTRLLTRSGQRLRPRLMRAGQLGFADGLRITNEGFVY